MWNGFREKIRAFCSLPTQAVVPRENFTRSFSVWDWMLGTDITGPIEGGIAPACRAFVAPIEATTGKQAYYVGKPNPLMMRTGLRILGVHSNEAVMIGDRMDTDVIAGIETGLDTVLVLSGVSTRETVDKFPYRPRLILNGVGDIPVLEK